MYLKLPIGFNFKQQTTSKQIISGQVRKYLKSWRNQRLYKPNYGIDWRRFSYDRRNDDADANYRLKNFLSPLIAVDMPQISVISVELQDINNPNTFNFYLVYKYKDIFTDKIYVQVNLDRQVDVRTGSGS